MTKKKETIVQGRKHSWESNAKIAQILVQGTQIKVTHEDGVITMLPAMEGIPVEVNNK